MSSHDYDALNEIINYLVLYNRRDCSSAVRKDIWKIGDDLIHYRDLTRKKPARPPMNQEELQMIDTARVACEKYRISN